MVHVDFTADLQRLHDSLRRIQALLAWHKLKQQETRPGLPPSFQMHDPTITDLWNEYSLFLCMRTRVRAVLSGPNRAVPESSRTEIGKELAELEQQLCQLGLSQWSWRP